MIAKKFTILGEGEQIWIWCPGCDSAHALYISNVNGHPVWQWNGSLDKPTFTPSLLVWGGVPKKQCHSYITDGMIKFLEDSFHSLKGQTVQLPELPEWLAKD